MRYLIKVDIGCDNTDIIAAFSQYFTPWINNQRMPIGMAAARMFTALRGGNDK